MPGLRDILEAATPGEWKHLHEIGVDDSDINTVYRDATDFEKHEKPWLEAKAIAGPPIYNNADARLIALAPELAALVLDMGAFIRGETPDDECDVPGCTDPWCCDHDAEALLARLDQLGKEQR